ncbi:MAG: triose-phosphate isomerase [Gemmatimonadetes bacterium]|nr:triose-phosphate isomerase [Gemmatimonadota bacterium]
MMTPRPVIGGNWKMHHGPADTRRFFQQFTGLWKGRPPGTIVFFPPAVSLSVARECLHGRPDLRLGVQNIHWEERGAFTGEISAAMAREAGAEFALVGHSERRHIFGERDEQAARKVVAALRAGLIPLLCVGETLEERRAGRVDDVILRQLDAVLDSLPPDAGLLLAYEPVWAIGTGENATPGDAAAAHAALRRRLSARWGASRAQDVAILYGGSVKPDNARDLLAAPEVDGLLVGGASLDPTAFAAIAATEFA